MRIISENLEKEANKLNEVITSYENNFIAYSNAINQSFSIWNDETSKKLQSTYSLEKQDITLTLQELKYLKNIYHDTAKSYKEVGEQIEYNGEEKEQVNKALASYQEQLNKVIGMYQNINISVYSKQEILMNHIKKLGEIKKKVQEIETEFQDTTKKIENIENSVETKLSSMVINKIEEIGEII